jgi:hypothetical protein
MDPSNQRYCLNKLDPMVADLDNERLREQLVEAMELNERAGEMELAYKTDKQTRSEARNQAAAIDDKVDRTLSSIHDIIDNNAEMDRECRARSLARELREEFFPTGVYHLTSAKFDEQHMNVEDLLDQLQTGFSEHVQKLGLEPMVETLAELNEEFGRQLDLAEADDSVTYDEVQEARSEAREAFHKVVFMIFGDYANQPETREKLLEPIENQHELIGRYHRRNGEPPTVDEENGEPVEPTDQPRNEGEPDESDGGGGSNDGGQPRDDSESDSEGDGEQPQDG